MHKYLNFKKMEEISAPAWQAADEYGLLNIGACNAENGLMVTAEGHQFINMSSCSYLGLDRHPKIIAAAIEELRRMGSLELGGSRIRIQLSALSEVEVCLSQLFSAEIMTANSCSTMAQHILPIIATGILTKNRPPVMIFDKHCHFSLNINKAVCGDETTVLTGPHNDMSFVEDCCKKYKTIAYVSDGAYSTGGVSPMQDLLYLQDRFGLFLCIDDSHGLSMYGEKGCGYARSFLPKMTDRTIIIATLSKAFGVSGGITMMGSEQQSHIVKRFTGPALWAQGINSAGLGGIKASAAIHDTLELTTLQNQLQENMAYFDSLIKTEFFGEPSPIRLYILGNTEKTLFFSREIFRRGFYTSALFFPIVPKEKAGLRIMLRSNLSKEQIKAFVDTLHEVETLADKHFPKNIK